MGRYTSAVQRVYDKRLTDFTDIEGRTVKRVHPFSTVVLEFDDGCWIALEPAGEEIWIDEPVFSPFLNQLGFITHEELQEQAKLSVAMRKRSAEEKRLGDLDRLIREYPGTAGEILRDVLLDMEYDTEATNV